MSSLDGYYLTKSQTYDVDRLDLDCEVQEHCNWFVNNSFLPKRKLIELGCGTGRYTGKFKELGYEVTGVDLSKDQLKIASTKIPTCQANASKVPIEDSFFSVACFIVMLQQVPNHSLEAVFKEAKRLLRPNSEIWIKTCSLEDLKRRPFNNYFPSSLKINEDRYPRIKQIVDLLDRIGFTQKVYDNPSNHYSLSGNEIIRRIEAKHNSTLHLIPKSEYRYGLSKMRKFYQNNKTVELSHFHSLFIFTNKA